MITHAWRSSQHGRQTLCGTYAMRSALVENPYAATCGSCKRCVAARDRRAAQIPRSWHYATGRGADRAACGLAIPKRAITEHPDQVTCRRCLAILARPTQLLSSEQRRQCYIHANSQAISYLIRQYASEFQRSRTPVEQRLLRGNPARKDLVRAECIRLLRLAHAPEFAEVRDQYFQTLLAGCIASKHSAMRS